MYGHSSGSDRSLAVRRLVDAIVQYALPPHKRNNKDYSLLRNAIWYFNKLRDSLKKLLRLK